MEQIREACICEERVQDLRLLVQIVSERPEVRRSSVVDCQPPGRANADANANADAETLTQRRAYARGAAGARDVADARDAADAEDAAGASDASNANTKKPTL